MAEPPYGIIWDLLKNGEVIPFLGAGASLSGRPPNAMWENKHAAFLPSGRELAHLLAEDSRFPSSEPNDRDDLAKVASYFAESSADRSALVNCLRNVFDRDYQVGQVHRFLADLPMPLLIVTTNYDDLIEKAFLQKGKPYHLVVHPTDRNDLAASVLWWKPGEVKPAAFPPTKLPLSLTETTIIYKMHGSIDRQTKKWDSFVITEEDYVEFLARMTGQSAIPARFMSHFRDCGRFLFLGYGLHDWNLRVMLKNLRKELTRRGAKAREIEPIVQMPQENHRSWAIQYRPSELEQILWQTRKVNIYDLEIDDFVAEMLKQMD